MNIISSKNIIREFCLIVFISTKQQKQKKRKKRKQTQWTRSKMTKNIEP